jgi:hypothetical protein
MKSLSLEGLILTALLNLLVSEKAMNKLDLPILADNVRVCFQVFGKVPPGEEMLGIWSRVLHDFRIEWVVDAFDLWLRQGSKPPAPSDIWKILNDRRADEIESQAKAEKMQHQRELQDTFRRSDEGAKAIQDARSMLFAGKDGHPKDWARMIVNAYLANQPHPSSNKPITFYQLQCACDALGRKVDDVAGERVVVA